ncbi:MAG TPA: hypothetical protein PLQ76_01550, partial [bacterium]|nr:hypothetical protein [bacterium]
MESAIRKISSEIEKSAYDLANRLKGANSADPEMKFDMYSPRAGHPDWAALWKRSGELASDALKVIECDAGSPA